MKMERTIQKLRTEVLYEREEVRARTPGSGMLTLLPSVPQENTAKNTWLFSNRSLETKLS